MKLVLACQECGAYPHVVCPGSDEVRAEIGVLLRAAVPDRVYCLEHARAAGWPWLSSEAERAPGRKRRNPYRRRGELFPSGQILAGAP